MDILLGSGRFLARRPPLALVPRCSKGTPDKGGRDKGGTSTDWDKAWTMFKSKGKRTLFSDFTPDKYVSWNPWRSEYPLSEDVDPIKRTESQVTAEVTDRCLKIPLGSLYYTFPV